MNVPNDLSSPGGVSVHNEDPVEADVSAATSVVLHGMMSTLSEVLGGLDARLASLEQQIRDARADTGTPRALAQTVEAAVARLSERIEALEAVATRPSRDEPLYQAVDSLRESVDALAVRPVRDDELHAEVAKVAELAEAAVTAATAERPAPPVRDDELHAQVAKVAELAEAAVAAAAAAQPVRDDELHAKVAELVEAVTAPPAAPGPDDPVRVGLASLHERLSVLLDVTSQPPRPDDAVRMGLAAVDGELTAVREQVVRLAALTEEVRQQAAEHAEEAALRAAEAAAAAAVVPEPVEPPGADPLLLEVGERVRRLESFAAASDEDMSASMRLALARLGELSAAIESMPVPSTEGDPQFAVVAADLAQIREALVDHPAVELTEAMNRVEEQMASIIAQPGPGPAMAMVAAGLAERLEARTDGLVDLLTSLARDLVNLQGEVATTARLPAAVDQLGIRLEETAAGAAAERQAFAAKLDEAAALAASLPDALTAATAGLPDAISASTAELTAAITEATAGLPDAITEATAGLPAAVAAASGADREAVLARVDKMLAAFTTEAESLRSDVSSRLERAEAAPTELVARVEEFVGIQFGELARREDAVAMALSDVRTALEQAGPDEALAGHIDRIRTVVEGHHGDIVGLREALRVMFESVERAGNVSSQVAELLLENRASLNREFERLQGTLSGQSAESSDLGDRVLAALATTEQLDGRLGERLDATANSVQRMVQDSLRDLLQAVRADVQTLAATGQDPAQLDAVTTRISESVQRESELLTQRVAALSVAVDALRTTLDSHVEETAHSIGRKASEVGRRLAADLGIRGTPKKPDKGAKDRSLGPGGK
jgi:hypothetical protein